jgi:1-phosphatidylinositol phosphodiesterase
MKNLKRFSLMVIFITTFFACEKDIITEPINELPETLSAFEDETLKSATPSPQPENWMGLLANGKKISAISIPGTHDSGATYEPIYGTAKCQNLTIDQQLNSGVRFLDIRCRHINNAFTIHHGAVYQNANFNDVLTTCWRFLEDNPTECIIMLVKEEHTPSNNNRTFEQTFDDYVQMNPNGWYLSNSTPDLGSVRGKIVLIRRFNASGLPKGIDATNWKDNTTFNINNPSASLKVQDMYKVTNNRNKWNAVVSLLNESNNGNGTVLNINYTSGYRPLIFGIPNIPYVSNYMNPRLVTYFNTNTRGCYGSIMMDFITPPLSAKIFNTNF